jgi:hypothetical protein
MLVTATVFQSAIGPYVVVEVVGSVNQAIAAVPAFASVMAFCAAACAGSTRSRARPARRCDRHARVELHRKRHDELQCRATCYNAVCVASSCNKVASSCKKVHQLQTKKTCHNTRYCSALAATLPCTPWQKNILDATIRKM